jgi:hypothetical protein
MCCGFAVLLSCVFLRDFLHAYRLFLTNEQTKLTYFIVFPKKNVVGFRFFPVMLEMCSLKSSRVQQKC